MDSVWIIFLLSIIQSNDLNVFILVEKRFLTQVTVKIVFYMFTDRALRNCYFGNVEDWF